MRMCLDGEMTDDTAGHVPETRVEAFLREHPELEPEIPGHGPAGLDQVIVDALMSIDELSRSTGLKIAIAQIKGKFGALQLYTEVDEESSTEFKIVEESASHLHFRTGAKPGSVRQRVHQIVDAATARASQVCVRCGKAAMKSKGVYRFCDLHARRDR